MVGINTKAVIKHLKLMREEIIRDSELTADERKPVALDQSMVGRLSRMDALQNQAMALEAERRRGIEIRRIDAALARIEEGEYGYCGICGEEIERKRLQHDSTVTSCIVCARDAE